MFYINRCSYWSKALPGLFGLGFGFGFGDTSGAAGTCAPVYEHNINKNHNDIVRNHGS